MKISEKQIFGLMHCAEFLIILGNNKQRVSNKIMGFAMELMKEIKTQQCEELREIE